MRCPKCNSDYINAYVLVSGFAWGNLFSGRVEKFPDYVEFDVEEAKKTADRFNCEECSHEWEREGLM